MGALGLIGLTAGIYSCATKGDFISDDANNTVEDQVIARAKDFMASGSGSLSLPDTYFRVNADSPATRTGEFSMPGIDNAIEPDWADAKVWETEQNFVTEVPTTLTRPITYTVLVEERGDTVSFATREPHTRILINEPKSGGESVSILTTFLPDDSWEGDLSEVDVAVKNSDYSGVVVYSIFDGTPVWGFRYEHGAVTDVLMFDNEWYSDRADPDTRILMGFSSAPETRVGRTIYIDAVTCMGYHTTPGNYPVSLLWLIMEELNRRGHQELYQFCYWLDGPAGGGGSGNTTPQVTVTVSASPANGGTVSGGGQYAINSTVNISATPNPGWIFVGWTSSGTIYYEDTTSELTSDQDMNFVAHFLKLPTGVSVIVGSNECVLGSIASAIQTKNGTAEMAAINQAADALWAQGINPRPSITGFGISINLSIIGQVMQSLDFVGLNNQPTYSDIYYNFINGGMGFGYIDRGFAGHLILLTAHDQSANSFIYYDATLGQIGTIGRDELTGIITFR